VQVVPFTSVQAPQVEGTVALSVSVLVYPHMAVVVQYFSQLEAEQVEPVGACRCSLVAALC